MLIRLRVQAKPEADAPENRPPLYPLQPSSWLAALVVHCAAITSLALISTHVDPNDRPLANAFTPVQIRRIVFYPPPKLLPDVVPEKKIGSSKEPRGAEISPQTIVAKSPNAKSKQQFIWQPAPKIEIKQDIQQPNLIARAATSFPAAPPPKQPPGSSEPVAQTKQPKAFVPPPPTAPQPKLTTGAPSIDAPDPSMGAPLAESKLPAGPGMPSLPQNMPAAPPGPNPSQGNARVDIAVASLHPDPSNRALPEGARPGSFSKAPTQGPASSGDVSGSGLSVPNLAIREEKLKPVKPPEEPAKLKTVLYADRVRSVGMATLSVPLRPANRMIPRAVDARFQGRSVYTMVVPIENLPAYAGDWILWFAEKEPKAGESPLMRAPLPYRKLEPMEFAIVAGPPGGERVQISAILKGDGKLEGIAVMTKASAPMAQAVLKDLMEWEFKPATRNGVPVAVEVVMEIPFNLTAAVAKRAE